MKTILSILFCALAALQVSAQDSGGGGGNPGGGGGRGNNDLSDKRSAIAIQAFKMGAVAVDYERMVGQRTGLQLTAGLFGVEGAFKVHTKTSIQSSSFSLALGWQPRNPIFEAVMLDPDEGDEYLSTFPKLSLNYEFRAPRYFTFSTGLGVQRLNYLITQTYTDPFWPYGTSQYKTEYNDWAVFLRIGIGVYFPI